VEKRDALSGPTNEPSFRRRSQAKRASGTRPEPKSLPHAGVDSVALDGRSEGACGTGTFAARWTGSQDDDGAVVKGSPFTMREMNAH